MTAQQKDTLDQIKSQLVPILLTIIGFFLVQTNNKIDTVSGKIDHFSVNQASQSIQIAELEKDVAELKLQVVKMNLEVTRFYENYGYLFSERTRKKLEE